MFADEQGGQCKWVGVNYQKHRKEKVRMVMELVRGSGGITDLIKP